MWGNIPQWFSALGTATTAILAVYALFFSQASGILVKYLQSELALRNIQISKLEDREDQLNASIRSREKNLANLQSTIRHLSDQKDDLEKKVAAVNLRLSKNEFALVREKIAAKLTSTIVVAWPFGIGREANSLKGEPAKTERLWPQYLDYMNRIIEKLNSQEKELGKEVVHQFIRQCESLSKVTFKIPPLKSPRIDYKQYFAMTVEEKAGVDARYKADEAQFLKKVESIMNRALAGQNEIVDCLKSVRPTEN